MNEQVLYDHCVDYMNKLCAEISERCVGSKGNRQATKYFKKILTSYGREIEVQEFDAIDWHDGGASLKVGEQDFEVFVSPYSLDFHGSAQLGIASTLSEIEEGCFQNKIILLHGDLAKEQLIPKNFPFYNPKKHQKIIAALEKTGAKAFVCATGRDASLAGGVYPFPLIEDGDFDIPSVFMTEEESRNLIPLDGKKVTLEISSKRISSNGYNVVGKIVLKTKKELLFPLILIPKKEPLGQPIMLLVLLFYYYLLNCCKIITVTSK